MQDLRILQVEDSERDAELVLRAIESGGIRPDSRRVDTPETMTRALQEQPWDVILVDCTMPRFDCFRALDVLKAHGEDIPLILVSGTVGEQSAVALMKAGVADYVMKSNLSRLVPAIVREVTDAGHRRARRAAELRLQERERMLTTAQRVAHLGSWERDYRANTLWWSEEFYRIIGRPLDYQPSTDGSYADAALPEDFDAVAAAIAAAREKGEPSALEHRIVRADGSVRWVLTRLEPEFDDRGAVHRLVGTVLDITERKEADEAIRFQAHLLDTVEQAIIATDLEGRITYWNKFAESLYGWSADEVLGQLIFEVTPSHLSADRAEQIWDQLRRGRSWAGEFLVQRRSGDTFWVYVSDTPIYSAAGNHIGTIGISFDITERKRAETALRESEEKYRTLLEQAADGIVVADSRRSVITVNTRACEMFGYDVDEFLGRDLYEFFDPVDFAANPPQVESVQSGLIVTNERSLRRKDGSYVPTETSTKRLDDGRIQVIIRDITERKQAEEALRQSEREYRNLFESANDAVIIYDAESEEVLDVNVRASEMYGLSAEELIGMHLRDLIGDDPMDDLQRGTAGADGVQGVEAIRGSAGSGRMNLLINASAVEFRGQQVILSIHRDVTAQKRLEEQLAHQALHDTLTGLANRALFRDRLEHALARARVDEEDVAVLMLDVDRFKVINESLGHVVGDRLLVAVSERLQEAARAEDTVARPGGDEFTILMEGVTSLREVTLVAERISNFMTEPLTLDGHDVVVTASIGIVLSTGGRGTADELLRNADIAMYQAKDGDRGGYVVFDPSMNATMLERLRLEADLRQAITRDELRVYFQPTISLGTGRVIGMEALVRWMHPTRGLLGPGSFIPLAEEAGLIRPLGRWVLAHACSQLRSWQANPARTDGLVLNVNLSAQEFQHPDLVSDIGNVLARSTKFHRTISSSRSPKASP
ncbi:MAG: PAS domain S-box protein [Thermomicrobiales bacterium]